jgi:hypothetical protein
MGSICRKEKHERNTGTERGVAALKIKRKLYIKLKGRKWAGKWFPAHFFVCC